MARPKLSPRTRLSIYIPEELYAELVLLKPSLQDSRGYTQYGAISSYFTHLLRKDLSTLKETLRVPS